MKPRKWDNEDLVRAVESTKSITGTLRELGVAQSGQAQRRVLEHIEMLGLDTSHWVGPGGNGTNRVPLNEILVANSTYLGHNQRIRRLLVESGVWVDVCLWCGVGPEWNGRPLVLTVDHINGKSNDHRLENLRLLCPNCHSQTETFGAKNGAKKRSCADCETLVSYRATRCKPCASNWRKVRNNNEQN